MGKMQSNKEVITEALIDKIAEDVKNSFPNDFKGLLTKTTKMLKKVQLLEKKWNAAKEAQMRNAQAIAKEGEEISTTAQSFKALYSDPTHRLRYYDIVKIIVETELFLDEVRKFFTGQELTYSVGLSYYGKLYEYNLTLLDMLKNAVVNIDFHTQGLKLRIAKSKSELIAAYGQLQKEEKSGTINEQYQQKKTNELLYQKLRAYWEENGKKLNGTTVNEGVLYETYRYYIENNINDFDMNNPSDLQFYEQAIIRSMNSTSGRQGGDIGQAQVKFVNASFATISNIRNTLKELSRLLMNFMKSGSQKEFSEGLKRLFTKNDKDIEEIEQNFQQEAKKHIDKVIQTIPNVTIT